MDLLSKTQRSLTKLNRGSYGKCESCGKMIEAARLEAMPTATLCISCAKKAATKPVRKFVKVTKKSSSKVLKKTSKRR